MNEKDFGFSLDEKPLICKAFGVIMLEDGTYEVFVVEVDSDPRRDSVHLDLTLVSGPRKGDVVRVQAQGLRRDPLDLLGVPGTLIVANGQPSLDFD